MPQPQSQQDIEFGERRMQAETALIHISAGVSNPLAGYIVWKPVQKKVRIRNLRHLSAIAQQLADGRINEETAQALAVEEVMSSL